jgi:hypothetical protein
MTQLEKKVFKKIKSITTNEGAFADKKIQPYKNYSFDNIKKYTTFNDVIEMIEKGYGIEWSINNYLKKGLF